MAPRSILHDELAPNMSTETRAMCVHLFCVLDLVQGEHGRPAHGYERLGREIGWQGRTVQRIAKLLAKAGWIELERDKTHGQVTMRVVWNPSRKTYLRDAHTRDTRVACDAVSDTRDAQVAADDSGACHAGQVRSLKDWEGLPAVSIVENEEDARANENRIDAAADFASFEAQFDKVPACCICGEPANGNPLDDGRPACKMCEAF